MPADPGEPDNDAASSNSASRRSRKCQVLFILGSGFDPSKQAAALAQEFRDEHEGLNFSKTATVIESADVWQSDDKIGFKKSVSAVVRKWCRDQAASFDPKRLLVGDYQGEDGRLFAVAGYFPRSKTSSSAGVLAEETQDTDSDGEPAELSDHAVDAESGSSKFSLLAEQFVATARRQFETARQLPPKRLMMAGGGVLILLVLVTVVTMFLPGGGSSDLAGVDPEPGTEASDGDDPSAVGVPQLAPPQFMIGLLRVYTPEPGFAVLVDGEPVRRADGEFVTTPCAITAEQGARTVTVFREGSFDLSRLIDVGEDSEVTLEPSNDGTGDGSDILRAPHLNAAVGEPIALTVLNSSRPEIDPYLTPDRLSIWFVGDRQEGRGIFVSTRLTPYHDFDEPRIISRSADLPATPSITDDSLYIVYAVPEKARLMSLARANPLAGFDSRDALRHSNSLAPTWTSSQMLGDGLRIYWVEETGDGQVRTLTSSRTKRTDDFGKTYKVELAGTHPCLSPDGLRQYTFNGKTLTRYRRTSPVRKFIEEATIAELELPNYQPSKRHRQFFVSSDEQWLFYSDEPQKSGDLFMVRISEGPQWGVAPRGKSIPAKRVIAAVTDPSPDPEMVPEDKPIPKPVDPRTIPLPYTSHWNIFTTLLNTRQYEEAEGLLRNAAANPELQKFSEQLTWDSADLKSIRDFWSRIDDIAAGFKTGETIRIGALRLEVTRFENGELIGKRGDVEVRKKLIELPSTELSGIFDAGVEKEDTQAQFLFAVMLAYDVQALERAREQRFERSGEFVATFRERQARRKLAQAVAELDRTNFGKGVAFLKEARALAADTPVVAEADKLEEALYLYVKWRPIGPRQWKIDGNSYETDSERSNGSLMASQKEYRNFEMSLEWKTDNTLTAQGGVFFHYPGNGELVDLAHKIHLSNDSGKGADQYSSGSLFGQDGPSENVVKPSGEWNTLEFRVVDKEVTVVVNGKKVLETKATKETVPERGLICLDGIAGGIAYRRILLSELPD